MEREELANNFQQYVYYVDDAYRSLVSELADDLIGVSGKQLDKWTATNIWELFNPARIFASRSASRAVGMLDDLASVVIFLPIAWTWFTLWQASTAFRSYLAMNAESQNTFFELWQSGFGGKLGQEFWFGRYVQVSVFAICALIGIYLIKGRMEVRTNVRFESWVRDWHVLLSELDRYLSTERSENPRRFEGTLERAASELRELLGAGTALVSAIHNEVGTIQSNIDAVHSASAALKDTIDDISEAQQAQADVFKSIYSGIDLIGKEVGRIPESLGNTIEKTFRTVNQVLESTIVRFTADMTRNLSEVEVVMQTLSSIQQGYIERGDVLAQHLAQILSDMPGVRGRIEMSNLSSQAEMSIKSNQWKPDIETKEAANSPVDVISVVDDLQTVPLTGPTGDIDAQN